MFHEGKEKGLPFTMFSAPSESENQYAWKVEASENSDSKSYLEGRSSVFMVLDFIVCFREFSFHVFAFMLKDYVTWYTLSTPRGGGHKKIYAGRLN